MLPAWSQRILDILNACPDKSQAGLARACGIKGGSVSGWFGKGKPTKMISGDNLIAAARYLGTTPEYIMTGNGKRLAEQETASQTVTLDSEMILDVVHSLQDVYGEIGLVFRVEDDPGIFADYLNDRVAMRDIRSVEAKAKVGKWLKRGVVQGVLDERATQVPVTGKHQGKTGSDRVKR